MMLSPAMLIAGARTHLAARATYACPFDEAHKNRMREYPVKGDEVAGMRFVNLVGYWSHFDPETLRSAWPIPHLETPAQLARFAQVERVWHMTPEPGDLAMRWDAERQRYAVASIITAVLARAGDKILCLTMDGYARGAQAKRRAFDPAGGDRFVRWCNLPPLPRSWLDDEGLWPGPG